MRPFDWIEEQQFFVLWRSLRSTVRKKTRRREEADDVVQEAWLRALEDPPARQERLLVWLQVVARHLVFQAERSEKSRLRREQAVARPEAQLEVDGDFEQDSWVVGLVRELPEPYGEVVRLRYLEDREVEEIARRLKRPPGTVRSQIRRGLDKLRVRLVAHDGHAGDGWSRRRDLFGVVPLAVGRLRRLEQSGVAAALAAAGAAGVAAVLLISEHGDRAHDGPDQAHVSAFESVALVVPGSSLPIEEGSGPNARTPVAVQDLGPSSSEVFVQLRGRAFDRIQDQPMPHARILAAGRGHPDDGELLASAGENGEFLADLDPRDLPLWIWAVHEDFPPTRRRLVDLAFVQRGEVLQLDSARGRGRERMQVEVVDALGHPVPGAGVWIANREADLAQPRNSQGLIERIPPPWHGWTDGSGSLAVCAHSTARVKISVLAEGQPRWSTWVDRDQRNVVFAFPRPAALQGLLRGPDGAPVEGATLEVAVGGDPAASARSDPDGRFTLANLPPGDFVLVARAGASAPLLSAIHRGALREGETGSLGVLFLSEAWSIAGCALEGGDPLPGWRVELRSACRASSPSFDEVRTAETAPDGSFAFTGCAGEAFDLDLFPPLDRTGISHERLAGVRPSEKPVLLERTRRTAPSAFLRGELRLDARLREAGIRLQIEGELLRNPLQADLGPDGCLAFGPLPPGEYSILVDGGAHGAWSIGRFQLAPEEQRDLGSIRAPAPGSLNVRMELPDGSPFEGTYTALLLGAGVELYLHSGVPATGIALERGARGLSIQDLWPGGYRLIVSAPSLVDAVCDVRVEDGALTELELPVEPGIRVFVRVNAPRRLEPDEELEILVHAGERSRPVVTRNQVVREDRGCVLAFNTGLPLNVRSVEVRSSRGLHGELDFTWTGPVLNEHYTLELREPW